jgi:hypothetical protein
LLTIASEIGDVKRAGKNPAKSAVARKILIAAWHVLSRQQPFKPRRAAATQSCLGKLPLLSGRLTAPHGIEKRDSSHGRSASTRAPKEK